VVLVPRRPVYVLWLAIVIGAYDTEYWLKSFIGIFLRKIDKQEQFTTSLQWKWGLGWRETVWSLIFIQQLAWVQQAVR
jgi:hypothetical protein